MYLLPQHRLGGCAKSFQNPSERLQEAVWIPSCHAHLDTRHRDRRYAINKKGFGSHAHPAILYKDHLYVHASDVFVRNGFMCMDLKGNIKWQTGKDPGFDKGGFILADDMIISSDGEKMLYLIDPSPEAFKVLAKAELLDTKQSWAPLALSDGKLVIRDQKQMKCILLK